MRATLVTETPPDIYLFRHVSELLELIGFLGKLNVALGGSFSPSVWSLPLRAERIESHLPFRVNNEAVEMLLGGMYIRRLQYFWTF